MSAFETPKPQIARDRWGRPLVKPLGGGKPVAYTRATTFVDCLDDKSNLAKWQQRQVLRGLRARPDLMLQVAAAVEDDKKLNAIADEALAAAGSHSKADIGTALHALTETVDAGGDISAVPAEYRGDLDAYAKLMRGCTVMSTETFTVLDDYQVAGTHDRRLVFPQLGNTPVIGDVKTGRIDYGLGKIGMQLAVYAHSQSYDDATGARSPLDVRTDVAVIIHLPAGQGTAEFVWVDIAKAWESIELAAQVRAWRKQKHASIPPPWAHDIDLIPNLIEQAVCEADLINIWTQYEPDWTAWHTALAASKKQKIREGVSA
jgi:hypothetical protein